MANGPNIKVYVGCEQMRHDTNVEGQWNDASGNAQLFADDSGVMLMATGKPSTEQECKNPFFVFVDNSGASPATYCGQKAQKLFAEKCNAQATKGTEKTAEKNEEKTSIQAKFEDGCTSHRFEEGVHKNANIVFYLDGQKKTITDYELPVELKNGFKTLQLKIDGKIFTTTIEIDGPIDLSMEFYGNAMLASFTKAEETRNIPAKFGNPPNSYLTINIGTGSLNLPVTVGGKEYTITSYNLQKLDNGTAALTFVMDGRNYRGVIPKMNGNAVTLGMRFSNNSSGVLTISAQIKGDGNSFPIVPASSEPAQPAAPVKKPATSIEVEVIDVVEPKNSTPQNRVEAKLAEIEEIAEELAKQGFPEYKDGLENLNSEVRKAQNGGKKEGAILATLEKYRAELAEFRDVFARLDEIKTIADELAALGDSDYKNEFPKIDASVRKKVDENNADIGKILAKVQAYRDELVAYRDELKGKQPAATTQKTPEPPARAEVKKETPEVPKAKATPKNAADAIAAIQKIDGYKNVADELKKIGKTFGELEKLGIKETDKKYLYLCARIFDAAEQGAKPADVLESLQNYHAELKKIKTGLEDKQRAADEAAKKAQAAAKEKPVDKKPEQTKPEAVKTNIPPATEKKVEKKEAAGVPVEGVEEIVVPPAKTGDEQKTPLGALPERERARVTHGEHVEETQGSDSFPMGQFPAEANNQKQNEVVSNFVALFMDKDAPREPKDKREYYIKTIKACEEVIRASKTEAAKKHYIEVKNELEKEKEEFIKFTNDQAKADAELAKEQAKAKKTAEEAAKKAAKDAEVAAKKAAEAKKIEEAKKAEEAARNTPNNNGPGRMVSPTYLYWLSTDRFPKIKKSADHAIEKITEAMGLLTETFDLLAAGKNAADKREDYDEIFGDDIAECGVADDLAARAALSGRPVNAAAIELISEGDPSYEIWNAINDQLSQKNTLFYFHVTSRPEEITDKEVLKIVELSKDERAPKELKKLGEAAQRYLDKKASLKVEAEKAQKAAEEKKVAEAAKAKEAEEAAAKKAAEEAAKKAAASAAAPAALAPKKDFTPKTQKWLDAITAKVDELMPNIDAAIAKANEGLPYSDELRVPQANNLQDAVQLIAGAADFCTATSNKGYYLVYSLKAGQVELLKRTLELLTRKDSQEFKDNSSLIDLQIKRIEKLCTTYASNTPLVEELKKIKERYVAVKALIEKKQNEKAAETTATTSLPGLGLTTTSKKFEYKGNKIAITPFESSEPTTIKAQLEASKAKVKYVVANKATLAVLKKTCAGIAGVVWAEKGNAKDNVVYTIEAEKELKNNDEFIGIDGIAEQFRMAKDQYNRPSIVAEQRPPLPNGSIIGFNLISPQKNIGALSIMEFNPFNEKGEMTQEGKDELNRLFETIQGQTRGEADVFLFVYSDSNDQGKQVAALKKAIPAKNQPETVDILSHDFICSTNPLTGGFPIVENGKYVQKKRVYVIVGPKNFSVDNSQFMNDVNEAIQEFHTKRYFAGN